MPCRPAISSMSLGRAWLHHLDGKLDEAHKHGFQGIELFYEDLEYFAKQHYNDALSTSQLSAAADIKKLCDERDLTIVSLGPFAQCEGLIDPEARKRMFERLGLWIELAHVLGTKIIQIPSSFLPAKETTGNRDTIIRDLIEVADIGLQKYVHSFSLLI